LLVCSTSAVCSATQLNWHFTSARYSSFLSFCSTSLLHNLGFKHVDTLQIKLLVVSLLHPTVLPIETPNMLTASCVVVCVWSCSVDVVVVSRQPWHQSSGDRSNWRDCKSHRTAASSSSCPFPRQSPPDKIPADQIA